MPELKLSDAEIVILIDPLPEKITLRWFSWLESIIVDQGRGMPDDQSERPLPGGEIAFEALCQQVRDLGYREGDWFCDDVLIQPFHKILPERELPMKNDEYGDRMKQYEQVTKTRLPARTYTIIRVDGRAFHTYLRNAEKPFDPDVITTMDLVAKTMCEEMSGARFAYTQSDEISFLLTDLGSRTQFWFGGEVQKVCSVAASLATAIFNAHFQPKRAAYAAADTCLMGAPKWATFDARVYTIPSRTEVANYFRWRQQDAIRNAINMAGRAQFSASELMGKNTAQVQEMLFQEHGINFKTAHSDRERRGGVVIKEMYRHEGAIPVRKVRKRSGGEAATVPVEPEVRKFSTLRSRWVTTGAPDFTWADGSFLADFIPKDDPGPLSWGISDKIHPELVSKVTNADDAWFIREVFKVFDGRDNVARSWLIVMNPYLRDNTPFSEILADNGKAVIAAAHAFMEGYTAS